MLNRWLCAIFYRYRDKPVLQCSFIFCLVEVITRHCLRVIPVEVSTYQPVTDESKQSKPQLGLRINQ